MIIIPENAIKEHSYPNYPSLTPLIIRYAMAEDEGYWFFATYLDFELWPETIVWKTEEEIQNLKMGR
jgi:hypothetical protein